MTGCVCLRLAGCKEYLLLVQHLQAIGAVHQQLLTLLEAEGEKSSGDQRVGGVFLRMVVELLPFPHQLYCKLHPAVVAYFQKHK